MLVGACCLLLIPKVSVETHYFCFGLLVGIRQRWCILLRLERRIIQKRILVVCLPRHGLLSGGSLAEGTCVQLRVEAEAL